MIFTHGSTSFESEKERNLYYKFFAGYLFNELVPGYETRLAGFCGLLNAPLHGATAGSTPVALTPSATHVSFDNHAYLVEGCNVDRGEFADILLHDHSTTTLVAIEAKVHSDWSYDKDIIKNGFRLERLRLALPRATVIHCLLITEAKWQRSRIDGEYGKLAADTHRGTRVLTWEMLLTLVREPAVHAFMVDQLARPQRGFGYRVEGGWFHAQAHGGRGRGDGA